MTDNLIQNEDSLDSTTKKSKVRSAAYPAITIDEAIKFVSEIYKHFRNAFAKRDDVIAIVENSHNRFLAASSYYGFLNREKDSYQVTELFKTINSPISEKERKHGLLTAFESPKLNKELIEKFDGDEIPNELPIHLYRFHKITEEAAQLAADIFFRNAKICNVIDENNRLYFKKTLTNLTDPSVVYAEVLEETLTNSQDNKSAESLLTTDNNSNSKSQKQVLIHEQKNNSQIPFLLPENSNDRENLKIRLTDSKFAYLNYPILITKKDINILRKQLDVLEEVAE